MTTSIVTYDSIRKTRDGQFIEISSNALATAIKKYIQNKQSFKDLSEPVLSIATALLEEDQDLFFDPLGILSVNSEHKIRMGMRECWAKGFKPLIHLAGLTISSLPVEKIPLQTQVSIIKSCTTFIDVLLNQTGFIDDYQSGEASDFTKTISVNWDEWVYVRVRSGEKPLTFTRYLGRNEGMTEIQMLEGWMNKAEAKEFQSDFVPVPDIEVRKIFQSHFRILAKPTMTDLPFYRICYGNPEREDFEEAIEIGKGDLLYDLVEKALQGNNNFIQSTGEAKTGNTRKDKYGNELPPPIITSYPLTDKTVVKAWKLYLEGINDRDYAVYILEKELTGKKWSDEDKADLLGITREHFNRHYKQKKKVSHSNK
jgi:hypothetical protein